MKGRGFIGKQFTGIFYSMGEFWEIDIPFIAGRVRLDAFKALNMPSELKTSLAQDPYDRLQLIYLFADCIDYGLSMSEIERRVPPIALQFLTAGDKHLRSAGSLLFQMNASSRSIDDSRMAIEMYLKAGIASRQTVDEEWLRKKVGHDLEKGVQLCVDLGYHELAGSSDHISRLPGVESRYKVPERPLGHLWFCYRLALAVGTTILRVVNNRDCRSSFKIS
jgi:hypothetical protein